MKLIILDRDGTLNVERKNFIKSADEWEPLPGALEAVAQLNQAGWHTMIVSNQSGLGRGLFDVSALNAMHAKMHRLLHAAGGRIDAIFYCPHTPIESCNCRKPLGGLFAQITERTGVEAHKILSVGDSLRDMQATVAAGCQPHLVLTGNAFALRTTNSTPNGTPSPHPAVPVLLPTAYPPQTRMHLDLKAFADWVIGHAG